MDSLIAAFASATEQRNGYALAETLSPVPPTNDSGRLYALQRSANAFSIQSELRYKIGSLHLDKTESNTWVDVYVAYWKAIGEILSAEEVLNAGKNQSKNGAVSADWVKVYETWKDVLNAVYRGYQIKMKADTRNWRTQPGKSTKYLDCV